MTSRTMTETLDQLRSRVDETKIEFENLQAEVRELPGKLAEVERRLKESTNEKAIRELIKKRSELQDAKEVKPLLLRGAHVRWLRAKSAHARAEGKQIEADYPAALAEEREAKAAAEEATRKHAEASAHRKSIETRSTGRITRAEQYRIEADELEAMRA